MKNKNGKALDEEQLNTVAGGGPDFSCHDDLQQRIEAEMKQREAEWEQAWADEMKRREEERKKRMNDI